jgi:TolB-like protein/DNA-binding winged helix-turn-helix (wHTH) protein
MDASAVKALQIGAWRTNPLKGTLTKGTEVVRVDARSMRLLMALAAQSGRTISVEKILEEVWEDVVVSPDSVYQAVASLRRLLGDDPKEPTYIATIPRLGYRMVAEVSAATDDTPVPLPRSLPTSDSSHAPTVAREGTHWNPKYRTMGLSALLFLLVGLGVFMYMQRPWHGTPPQSVAVLPFTDLTSQAMDEEYFADGMTEELIDRLSHVPGLHVPAATSSFSFKGKKLPITDIGKALGVAYILDGSVRQSGSALRITARLARVDDGYIVWSQSYDRPAQDKLKVQEDIAREVAASLAASVKQ